MRYKLGGQIVGIALSMFLLSNMPVFAQVISQTPLVPSAEMRKMEAYKEEHRADTIKSDKYGASETLEKDKIQKTEEVTAKK